MLTKSGLAAAIAAVVLRRRRAVVALRGTGRDRRRRRRRDAAGRCGARVCATRRASQRTIAAPRVARGDPIRAVYRATNRESAPLAVGRDRRPLRRRRDPGAAAGDRPRRPHRGGGIDPHPPPGRVPGRPDRDRARRRARSRRRPAPINEDVGTVLVHPRLLQPVRARTGRCTPSRTKHVIRRSASDPLSGFVSLREYVAGDDPRLIHWPTSARMGTLMLREHVELRRPEFTVVLDAADSVADADDFEEMVDIVASIAVHALRSGVEVRVRTTAREFPGAAAPADPRHTGARPAHAGASSGPRCGRCRSPRSSTAGSTTRRSC